MKSKDEVLTLLAERRNAEFASQLAHFGIDAELVYGWRMPELRSLAKELGKNHSLAMELYKQPVHEAKLLAAFMAEPQKLTKEQCDEFVKGFYSWDLVDQFCASLLIKSPFALELSERYIHQNDTFARRTGIVMIVQVAQKRKDIPDKQLIPYLSQLEVYLFDKRNFVKKALSWALRTMGKRSVFLNKEVLAFCYAQLESSEEKWALRDAIRELESEAVQERLRKKEEKTLI